MATMRITTGMAMNTYRYNLQNSTYNLTDARNKVLSHRQFDTYAEDPTAAAQAWKIRRAMVDSSNYQENNSDTYSRFNIGWATMGMLKTKLESTADDAQIRARTDSTAGARMELGKVLNDTADSVIQAMNSAKYGDHFVFAGDDEMNAPFSWSEDGKTLYYRGVNVNAGLVRDPADPENIPDWAKDADGNVLDPATMTADELAAMEIPATGKDELEDAWIAYFKDTDTDPTTNPNPTTPPDGWTAGTKEEYGVPEQAKNLPEDAPALDRAWAAYYKDQGDVQRLKELSEEYENVDLGMGLQEDENDKLINGTAFNRSLPGINMLGHGIDEDGDPVNIVMIMKRLGEIYGNCDPDDGKFSSDPEECEALTEEADRLMNKFQAATDHTNSSYVDIETKANYLNQNQARLKLQGDYLQEERANIEDVDMADAITQFSWDYYCYSAALKVGTQLLSQSLIDYMS